MSALRLMLALGAALVLATGAARAAPEKRVALVVGESAYRSAPHLPNTATDARLMARTLQGLGFTLIGGQALVDLDRAALSRAVRQFGDALANGTAALFYYAGHGVQIDGTNYLVPLDADPAKPADADFELIDVGAVLRQMEGGGAGLNIVILDACRNNPFGGRGLRGGASGLAQMTAPKGTLISYATQPGNVAADGPAGGDSPFTTALAAAMQVPGRTVFETFNTVGLAVGRSTAGAQQPWLSSSPIRGEFFFAGRPAAPALAQDPAAKELADWDAIKDKSDGAVFTQFLAAHPGGAFAPLAQARLDALAQLAPATKQRAVKPGFDGTWRGVMTCGPWGSGQGGTNPGIVLKVKDGALQASRHYATIVSSGPTLRRNEGEETYEGHIAPDGTVTITGSGRSSAGNYDIRFAGKVDDGLLQANGTYDARWGLRQCTMTYQRD